MRYAKRTKKGKLVSHVGIVLISHDNNMSIGEWDKAYNPSTWKKADRQLDFIKTKTKTEGNRWARRRSTKFSSHTGTRGNTTQLSIVLIFNNCTGGWCRISNLSYSGSLQEPVSIPMLVQFDESTKSNRRT